MIPAISPKNLKFDKNSDLKACIGNDLAEAHRFPVYLRSVTGVNYSLDYNLPRYIGANAYDVNAR